MIPTKNQWNNWSLPSKLTAIGTLVGILSFAAYLVEKGYGLSSIYNNDKNRIEDVYLVVEFNNKSQENISIFQRGEVYYWHPGSTAYHEVYTFELVYAQGQNKIKEHLIIPAKTKLKATAMLLPTIRARSYLEQGHMSISLYMRGTNIDGQFSENIAFTKNNLTGTYLPIELKTREP